MTIWDFKPKGDMLTTVAVGVGVAVAPVAVPWAWYAVRPVIKAVLKSGFLLYETGRGVFGSDAASVVEKPRLPKKSEKVISRVAHQPERHVSKGEHETPAARKAKEKPARDKPKRPPRTSKKKAEKE
ncbi:MAG TPA: hypothetical protein VK463_01450 [Desulfomonilaceae bacterium]|nr:hypothetical protein [Desulfomonilaceae bacterium]